MLALEGLRVLNTRPKEQAAALSAGIRQAGGFVIERPALEIKPTPTSWTQHLPSLQTVNFAIFISANAVNYFFQQVSALSWPASIKVIPIGQATAKALQTYGISPHAVPSSASSEDLLSLECLQLLSGQTVLLAKGEGGRPLIETALAYRGARIIPLHLYKRFAPTYDRENLQALWLEDQVDVIILTSEESIRNFYALLNAAGRLWWSSKPILVISQRLAEVVLALGGQSIHITDPANILAGLITLKTKLLPFIQNLDT